MIKLKKLLSETRINFGQIRTMKDNPPFKTNMTELSRDQISEDVVPARKQDVKKMEMKANKIVGLMKGLAKDFKRAHGTKETMLWTRQKDWEELARKADMEYGGWFGYVYDSDFVDKK